MRGKVDRRRHKNWNGEDAEVKCRSRDAEKHGREGVKMIRTRLSALAMYLQKSCGF